MVGENQDNFLVHYLVNICWKYVWSISKKMKSGSDATSKNFSLFDYFDTKSFYFQFGHDVFSTLKKVRLFQPFLTKPGSSYQKNIPWKFCGLAVGTINTHIDLCPKYIFGGSLNNQTLPNEAAENVKPTNNALKLSLSIREKICLPPQFHQAKADNRAQCRVYVCNNSSCWKFFHFFTRK